MIRQIMARRNFTLSLSGGTFHYVKPRQRWWRRGSMLANGNWCSGFESRRRLRFFPDFSPHPDFTTSVSATPALDVRLFFSYCLYLFLYGLIASHLAYPYLFFPLNSYANFTNLTNVSVGTQLSGRTKLVLLVSSGGRKGGDHVEPGPSCLDLTKEASHLVVTAPGHDDVRVRLGGRDEHVEGRLDELRVLLDHALQVPAALRDVPLQTTTQPGCGTWWNLMRTLLYAN